MQNKLYIFIAFAALMILACFIRVHSIDRFSLFGDEKQSVLIGVANTNISGMSNVLKEGKTFTPSDFWADRGISSWLDADARGDVSGNSLVHDMMLKVFANLFGRSDAVFRGVSVFFNLLTVWLLFYWYRKMFAGQSRWQLLVLVLAVIEPFFVIYSQQARNYTTSIFFSTLSNYFFWVLVMKQNGPANRRKYVIGWIIASTCALFSTYLTALVLVGQGLYLCMRFPTKKVFFTMLFGGIIAALPMLLWILIGPGKHFLGYQADAAAKYLLYIQENGPIAGWIEPSTLGNLTKRTISIVSDQFLWTNDIYLKKGYRFGGVALLLFSYGVYRWLNVEGKQLVNFYLFCLIQIFLPIIVLIAAAINAGTTTGFFIRYASFALPLGIFVSVGYLKHLFNQTIWIRVLASLYIFIQMYFQVEIFRALYSDSPQKYTFSNNRASNPYPRIASKIIDLYQPGDTVIYPSVQRVAFSQNDTLIRVYNTADAQLVNLYLPENASYLQKIEINNQDSILIKRPNGKVVLLFDFSKNPHRY